MGFDIEIRLQGFLRSQYDVHDQSTNVLHIHWNVWRRVFRRTLTEILPPNEDELLGPSGSALFGFRFGTVSDLHPQILRSLASLNFVPTICNFLCPKITAYTMTFAAARTGPPYPSMTIMASVNFVEKLCVDYIDRPLVLSQSRQLASASFLDETLVIGTSTEEWGGADDEETDGDDNNGVTDSEIEMLRRRKFEWKGGEEEEENCSICLETFSDGEEVIPLQCDHTYHESCVVAWLKESQSCPLCRGEIQ